MDAYESVRILGRGSFGLVTLVRDRDRTNDSVQVRVAKEVSLHGMPEEVLKETQREADLLRSLSHANIVAYHATIVEDEKLYIIMEYACGGDLGAAIKLRQSQGTRFSEQDCISILGQCGSALGHVHGKHIVHRDIKSQNIFLTGEGFVKLGDFGIARTLEHSEGMASTVIGTPSHLPPEVCDGKAYGTKADIWCLGVVFYEALSLELPFQAMSLAALSIKIVTGKPRPLSPDIYSAGVRWLVETLLQKDVSRRPDAETLNQHPLVRGCVGALSALPVPTSKHEDHLSTLSVAKEVTVEDSLYDESASAQSACDVQSTHDVLLAQVMLQLPEEVNEQAVAIDALDRVGEGTSQPNRPENRRAGKSTMDACVDSIGTRLPREPSICGSTPPLVHVVAPSSARKPHAVKRARTPTYARAPQLSQHQLLKIQTESTEVVPSCDLGAVVKRRPASRIPRRKTTEDAAVHRLALPPCLGQRSRSSSVSCLPPLVFEKVQYASHPEAQAASGNHLIPVSAKPLAPRTSFLTDKSFKLPHLQQGVDFDINSRPCSRGSSIRSQRCSDGVDSSCSTKLAQHAGSRLPSSRCSSASSLCSLGRELSSG